MILLNTTFIDKTNGLYALQAQENLSELRELMKNLIIKRPEHSETIWATDKPGVKLPTEGGRVWAHTGVYRHNYVAQGKPQKKVKTFAL